MSRATEIEKLKRIKAVAQWISDGHTTAEIIHNIVVKWGLSESQAYKYIADVKAAWKEDLRGELEELRDLALQRSVNSLTRLKSELDSVYSNSNLDSYKRVQMIGILENRLQTVRQDIAKLQGLYTEKIEHGGNIVYQYPPRLDVDEEVENDDIE